MGSKPKKVTKATLQKFLKQHPEWRTIKRNTVMTRTFTFPDFVSGLTFIARIAVHAEVANHHPDLMLSYGRVEVHLTTHDAKSLTQKDINLATKIDTLY